MGKCEFLLNRSFSREKISPTPQRAEIHPHNPLINIIMIVMSKQWID